MNPTIEILPINKAPWIQSYPGLNWAYRVTPRNKENTVIGAMKGTREQVEEKAENIKRRMTREDKCHPFTISIKPTFNRTGL